MAVIVALALVTAVVAGARSTWSACGASVLSTLTPQTETGRGNRWGTTAAFFLVGSTAGGLATGALAAAVTPLTGRLEASTAIGVAAALALVAAGLDRWRGGRALPPYRRQLDEDDLVTYRSWVYGTWWGLQIGVGFATISMTAGVALTFALAALTGSVVWALAIGAVFGLVRGFAIVPARGLHDAPSMMALHRRMDELEEPTRRATLVWLVAAAAIAAAVAAGLAVPLAAAAGVAAAVLAWVTDGGGRRRAEVACPIDDVAATPASASAPTVAAS